MQDLAGKTALVTGGSSGTGKAAVQQLAGRGAHVILSGLGQGPRCRRDRRNTVG